MHYTWQMLGWTRQSLRETAGTLYYTWEMKKKGTENSTTTFPQLLTAAANVSLGGGRWLRLLFIFGDMFVFIYPSVLLFKHNLILQPHMLPRCLELVCLYINDHHLTSWFCTFVHMAMDAEWNHQRKFQCRYLPWIAKEMSYYVLHGAALIIKCGKRIWRNMQEEFHSAAESCCKAFGNNYSIFIFMSLMFRFCHLRVKFYNFNFEALQQCSSLWNALIWGRN